MVRHEYSEIVSVVVAAWRVTQSAVERIPLPPNPHPRKKCTMNCIG
jgi:hypothetical protein